jgi:HB1, ASXL, restriction endonuclease HTH domain
MAQEELTWPKAIAKVLGASPTPLHYKEITERIIALSLRKSLGATPAATVNAQMANSIKHQGSASPYIRVAKGVFAMRGAVSGVAIIPERLTPDIIESSEDEEQYDIVTSFGMFWRRNAVEWIATPKILGMQEIGATPVDFNKQLGIYLLYDGREVIYVGRSTDRPLGRRLYEHTIDRMSTRWDRFSWFGLLPVSESGQLGKLPADYQAATIIPALEAILIEALEPPQNRKRGDDLAAVEYIQRVDPEIEKRRMKATLDAALDKL